MKKIVSLLMSILMVAVLLPYNSWALELTEDSESFEEVQEEIFEETEETPTEDESEKTEYKVSEPVSAENQLFNATSVSSGSCGAEGDNVKWNFDSDGVLTISGTGAMKDYTSYNSKPWHSLNVTSLVIESGITRIGNYCFYGKSNIKGNLSLPSTLTSIGDYAFNDCSGFTGKLQIPSKVTSIGKEAFRKCSGFTGDLVIPSGVTEILGYTFCNCTGLTGKISMGEVTSIGNYAFWKCAGITNDLVLPESLKNIGESAFYGSGIKNYYFTGNAVTAYSATVSSPYNPSFPTASTVYYPESDATWTSAVSDGKWKGYAAEAYNPKYLGAIAYGYCGADSDGKNVEWCLNSDGTLVLTGTGAMADYTSHIGMPWYSYRNSVKAVVIEEGVTNIGSYSFINHHYIASINIASTVTKIGEHAFEGLEELTGDLVIPDAVKSIGDYAFSGILNNNLGKIIIGDGVETIGICAFYSSMFTGLELGNSLKSIGMQAFSYMSEITGNLVLPESLVEIGDSAFENTGFSGDVIVPESVLTIGSRAFYNCGVNSYYFKGNAPSVYAGNNTNRSFDVSSDTIYYPFADSSWTLTDGKWKGYTTGEYCPGSVAFGYCGGEGDGTNLKWILEEDGTLTVSGTGAMADYDYNGGPWKNYYIKPKTLVVDEGATSIGSYAFYNCSQLEGELVIPDSVVTIGDYAFDYCGFTSLTIGSNVKTIGKDSFNYCDKLTGDLIIPDSVTTIKAYAFADCTGLNGNLVLSKNLTSIGAGAFVRCSNLSGSLVVPEGVTTIETSTFYECGINEYYFKNNAPSASDYTPFDKSSDIIYYPYGNDTWVIEDGRWNGYMARAWYPEAVSSGFCGADADGKNVRWYIDSEGTLFIIGTGAMKDYNYLPDIPWYNNSSIKKVVMSEGITRIGEMAFVHCDAAAETIVLPQSLESIGREAFWYCDATRDVLNIPENVTKIEIAAFYGCGINSYLFEGVEPKLVYEESSSGQSFDSDDYIYFNGKKGDWALDSNGKWEGYNASPYCGYCGDETENHGENVEWTFDFETGKLTVSGTGRIKSFNTKYVSPSIGYITDAPWSNFMDKLKTLEIKEGITEIGYEAFRGCSGFTGELKIPESVVKIYGGAFNNCSGFTGDIIIPDNVTWIGGDAFYNCSGFNGKLYLGESLERISDAAFSGCTNLTGAVTIPGTVTLIGNSFENCSINEYYFSSNPPRVNSSSETNPSFDAASDTIYYPFDNREWVITDGKWNGYKAVGWKNDLVDFGYCGAAGNEENLKWALKKDGTLTIWGTGAMANYYYESVNSVQCSTAPWAKYPEYLKTLVLEEGMTSIGEFAFYKCSGFTGDIVIPKGVTTIGKTSFFGCTGFNGTLTIPDTVATVGENVFMNCTGLTGNIVIPDSVKVLGFQSFKGCTGFNGTLSIGKGLCIIQNSVFSGCTGLTGDLILSENITNVATWAFKNCGIDNFYFKGDAPAVHAASDYYPTFDAASDTIYYIVERDNWNVEDGLWNGYKAVGANLGDVYSDGEVNVMDASYVRRMIVKLVEPTAWQRVLADVNADGKVNVVDANLIRKFAAKIITSFPI